MSAVAREANCPPSDFSDPVRLFDSALEAYRQAEIAAGNRISHCLQVAGHSVELSFAGDALVPHVLPALAHLSIPKLSEADLTICLWDGATTGMNLPNLPWAGKMVTRRGEIEGFGTPHIFSALDRSADTLSMADIPRRIGLFCTRDPRRLPRYDTASPLRTLFSWGLRRHGIFLVHAGAVGTNREGVLLVGKGGSGKTTTALACLNSDLDYVSDDYCLVSTRPPLNVYSLYNSAKVTVETLDLLPSLRSILGPITTRQGDKSIVFLERQAPEKLTRDLALKAILIPRVTGITHPRLVPAAPAAALGALALSTMVQLPGAGSETLEALRHVSNQLPCYYIEVGRNTSEIPKTIQSLLGH